MLPEKIRELRCCSEVSALFFIVACVADVFGTGVYGNVIQQVTGFIMYMLFLLLPAAIMAVTAADCVIIAILSHRKKEV